MKRQILEAIEQISDMLEQTEGADPSKINELAISLYESTVGKYRPVLNAVPLVADAVAKDLVPIVVSIQNIFNTVRRDPAIVDRMDIGNQIKAEQRFKAMKAFQKAGFTRAEAFALVMQDAANIKAMLSSMNFSSSKKE